MRGDRQGMDDMDKPESRLTPSILRVPSSMRTAPATTDLMRQCRWGSIRGIDTPRYRVPQSDPTRYRTATYRIRHGREGIFPQKSGEIPEPLEQGV